MTKRKKTLCAFLVGLIGLSCSSAALWTNTDAESATLEQNVAFEQTYSLNQTVNVPTSKLTYEGKAYDSTVKVICPDGSAYLVSGDSISATQSGVYTIVYYAVVDGGYVSVEKQFSVKNSAITFSGDKSTYYYGAHTKYATQKEGIVLSLAQGETMYYNNIIDLNALNGERAFSMFTTPESEPMHDAVRIVFTFTDIYDPSNSVTVRVKTAGNGTEAWSNNNAYCDAKANSQDFIGLEPFTGSSAVSIVGGSYAIHRNSGTYGSPIIFSLGGYIDSSLKLGDREYGVAFDFDSKIVYSQTEVDRKPITDLDNALCNSELWEGFTTGEVFLSVHGENYEGGRLGLVFTDIAGHDLTADEFEVTTKPIVEADLGDYTKDNVPKAIVGEKYKLFNASAYDVYDGTLTPVVKVFYGYASTNPTQVGIENGYFKPLRAGTYTIEYSAVNANGVKAKTMVNVQAVSTTEKLAIEINGKNTMGGVGQNIRVADSYAIKNAMGNSNVEIVATHKQDAKVRYEIDETLTFQPYYSGTYTITFTYSDYLFEKTESFDLEVTVEGGAPLITKKPLLPDYLIQGKTYEIPSLDGYVFTTGSPVSKTCKVYIQEDEAKRALTDSKYTVGNFSKVTVIYELSDGKSTVEKQFPMDVISTTVEDKFTMSQYFVATGNGATATTKSDCVEFASAGDATWEFINLLVAKKVEWRVRTVDNAINFKYLDFYLTDAIDPNQTIKISFNQSGSYLNVRLNDKDIVLISAAFGNFTTKDLYVKYVEEFGSVIVDGNKEIKIDSYINGMPFEGFTSGKVILTTGISEVTGPSKIAFRKINNQNIRNMSADKTMPIVYFTMHKGYQTIGDKVRIEAAVAGDVLDPYTTLKFTIVDENGYFVTADDGTRLDGTQPANVAYTFTIDKFGTYEVAYEAYDSALALAPYSYVIHSVDTQSPTIRLTNMITTGKVA